MKNLRLKQLDREFDKLRPVKACLNIPPEGWVRTIRKALGMTTAQLACRLGFNRARIVKIEMSELEGAVTLATLHKVAEALHCEFAYTFLPKKSLEATLEAQAQRISKDLIDNIAQSMALEAQNLTKAQKADQKQELVQKLLSGPLKYLWADDAYDLPRENKNKK